MKWKENKWSYLLRKEYETNWIVFFFFCFCIGCVSVVLDFWWYHFRYNYERILVNDGSANASKYDDHWTYRFIILQNHSRYRRDFFWLEWEWNCVLGKARRQLRPYNSFQNPIKNYFQKLFKFQKKTFQHSLLQSLLLQHSRKNL